MKVLQIHNNYRFLSGEDVMYAAIVRLLRKEGQEVCVFERDSKDIRGLRGKMRALTDGVYSRSARKAVALALAAERPDVVNVHNLYPLISPSILLACRDAGVPVAWRCADLRLTCPVGLHGRKGAVCELCRGGREYWCVLKNCGGSMPKSVGYALRNAVARKWRLFRDNVTLFLPVSEFVRRYLIDAGVPEGRIVVVPSMRPIPASAVDPSSGEYVAYAGRISREKGIGTLLESARQLGYPVCLAGDPSLMPELVKSAPPNARFWGQLRGPQLDEFYRNARFLVVPSIWYDTFPGVVLEAMTYGLPVIGARIGGIPEQVDDGVTGLLFEPGNADDLAEKSKLLWENPDLCRQMGKAGREKAIREYSEDVYYTRLMAAYKKAIQINKEAERHANSHRTTGCIM